MNDYDDWDDDDDDVDIEPVSPQPTKAPVLLATEGKAPTLTPAQATAAIDAKMNDADFRSLYFNKYKDEAGHRNAVAEMERLHAAAHVAKNPLLPPPIEPEFKSSEGDKTEGDGEQTAEPTEAEAALAEAQAEAAHLLGENAEERIEGAKAWLTDEGVAAVHSAGYANDAAVIAEIAELAERDGASNGLLGAALGELIGKGVYYARAADERLDLNDDAKFQTALMDAGHPRHAAAQARLTALGILEKPSPWMRASLEKFYAK